MNVKKKKFKGRRTCGAAGPADSPTRTEQCAPDYAIFWFPPPYIVRVYMPPTFGSEVRTPKGEEIENNVIAE